MPAVLVYDCLWSGTGCRNVSRSDALDPDLLTAEIGLLLDYLSGLPERTLTTQLARTSPARLGITMRLYAIFPYRREGPSRGNLASSDIQFLLELRDYLNSWADLLPARQ